jgi:hypothetical protein
MIPSTHSLIYSYTLEVRSQEENQKLKNLNPKHEARNPKQIRMFK